MMLHGLLDDFSDDSSVDLNPTLPDYETEEEFINNQHHHFFPATGGVISGRIFFPFYTSTPTFESLGLKSDLIEGIHKSKQLREPCDMQQRIIRAVATGRDVLIEDTRGTYICVNNNCVKI